MDVLRELISESITAAATHHALRRHREEDQQNASMAKKPSAKPSKILPDEGRQALYDAIKLVGPHMSKQIYDKLKTIPQERIKDSFGNRIYSYRFSMRNKKNMIPNAKVALAKAILFLGEKGEETISSILNQYLSQRIESDVKFQKGRMDDPWDSGEMSYKSE